MQGNDGSKWLWCAGFACFIVQQAVDVTGNPAPVESAFSCDTLAERAKNRNIFISERALGSGEVGKKEMPPCSLFLSRRIPGNHIKSLENTIIAWSE